MKNRKVTLISIIVLLIIFVPISIFSTIMHFKNIVEYDDNINHEFRYDGKLYFYNNDKLLGTYTCENEVENCDYATNSYIAKYSLDEREEQSEKLGIINNRYAFLIDDDGIFDPEIILYDISLGKTLGKYTEVKDYTIGIENDYYILKNENDLYGVISLDDGINLKVPFQYDYIGLVNKVDSENGKIIADTFAVLEDGKWYLIDVNGARFTDAIESDIFSYNGEYIILKNSSGMSLINYKGISYLSSYKYLNFYNKYLEVIDNFNNFYLTEVGTNNKISKEYSVDSIDDVTLEIEDNNIKLFIKGNYQETIEIQ
jgi:hypothetical protein